MNFFRLLCCNLFYVNNKNVNAKIRPVRLQIRLTISDFHKQQMLYIVSSSGPIFRNYFIDSYFVNLNCPVPFHVVKLTADGIEFTSDKFHDNWLIYHRRSVLKGIDLSGNSMVITMCLSENNNFLIVQKSVSTSHYMVSG